VKCAQKKKKTVERNKKGLDRASVVRDGRFADCTGRRRSASNWIKLLRNWISTIAEGEPWRPLRNSFHLAYNTALTLWQKFGFSP
jgi:hypothetical protein